MKSEWKTVRLGEIATVKGGKRLPKGTNLITSPNKHPYIRVRDLNGEKTLELNNDYEYVDDVTQKTIARYTVEKGDIVLSIVGTIGLIGIVGESLNGANLTENCVKLTSLQGVDKDYLYYFLKSAEGQQEIKKGIVGAVQAKLPIKNIQAIELELPDIETQLKIVSILKALDDKIALNNKINDNLEQQAQAVYDLTFISFDGVSNNEFQESEFGMIPKGWTIRQLSDVTKNVRDRVKDNMYEVLSALNTGNLCPSEEYFSKQVFSKNIKNYIVVEPFDFAYNPSRINIGSIGMNDLGYTGCVSPVYVVVRPEKEYQYFLDFFIKSKRFKEEVKARASGSVRQSLSYADFGQIKVIYPPIDVVEKFNGKYAFLLSTMNHYKKEIKILENLRDVLLPKLMNGEIDLI